MLENIFVLTAMGGSLPASQLLICTAASLVLGLGVAGVYMYRNGYTKNFVITLALLPAMVQIVIMMVNGNVGTGVAVMGAFSLVRFRSVPGSSREISSIFMSMAIGLATGMGCVDVAVLFLVIIGAMNLILAGSKFGEKKLAEKELRVTIPENLNYAGMFDDLFKEYTQGVQLVKVKTVNMGSLYELQYHILLKDAALEKEFLDQVRCRNGNLSIICGKPSLNKDEL